MSLRTDILKLKDSLLPLTGPGSGNFDIRTTQLTVRTRVWSGTRIGSGVATDTDLVLPKIYKIREVSAREVASSGGRYQIGDVWCFITPKSGSAGWSQEQLAPTVSGQATEVIYLLAGEGLNGEYSLLHLKPDKAFTYRLELRRSRRSP